MTLAQQNEGAKENTLPVRGLENPECRNQTAQRRWKTPRRCKRRKSVFAPENAVVPEDVSGQDSQERFTMMEEVHAGHGLFKRGLGPFRRPDVERGYCYDWDLGAHRSTSNPTSSVPTLGGSSSERTTRYSAFPQSRLIRWITKHRTGSGTQGIYKAEAVLKEAFTCQGRIRYIRPIE